MKRLALLLALALLTASLSGCKSGIAARKADDSRTLYVGHVGSSLPTSFMPWLSRDGIAPTVASMLYNTLFSYDDESGEFEPLTAKRWCYVSLEGEPLTDDGTFAGAIDYAAVEACYADAPEDYMVVRVELFDDVRWSDGERLTVEDVYYSFDIATDNALSNHAGALAWTADLRHESSHGQLVKQGMFTARHPDYSGTFPILPGEEDTVMYLLVNKVLGAVTTLFSTILILPEHIWAPLVSEENQLNNKNPRGAFLEAYENPVGSGAWILNREETNSQVITLDRNPDYHLRAVDGSPLYKVDRLRLMLYLDANTAIFALRKGYVDLLDTSISSNYLRLFEREKDIFVARAAGTAASALVLNVNPPAPYDRGMRTLFKNLDLRRAIALAIDQEKLVAKVLDGAGSSAPSGLILPGNALLYNPDADKLTAPIQERLDAANALLDALWPEKDGAGYRLCDGARLSFEILASAGQQDLVAYLQRQLQRVGIEVRFKAAGSTPESTYLYPGNFDMTVQGVNLSMANADVMYRAHFVTVGRSSNYGRYQDEEMAAAIEEMRYTLNRDAKVALIKRLQELTAAAYYKLPLYAADALSVARTDRCAGYVAEDGQSAFNLDTLKNLRWAGPS